MTAKDEVSCEHCGRSTRSEIACDYCGCGMCNDCDIVHEECECCPITGPQGEKPAPTVRVGQRRRYRDGSNDITILAVDEAAKRVHCDYGDGRTTWLRYDVVADTYTTILVDAPAPKLGPYPKKCIKCDFARCRCDEPPDDSPIRPRDTVFATELPWAWEHARVGRQRL